MRARGAVQTRGSAGGPVPDRRLERVGFEPGGWATGWIAVQGDPEHLLERQRAILSPAKVAEGPSLRAELPVRGETGPAGEAVWSALRSGMAALHGHAVGPRDDPDADRAAARELDDCAASPDWPGEREAGRWVFRVDAGALSRRIVGKIGGGVVTLATTLAHAPELPPVSRQAVAHFLLAVNARLRLARGALYADRIDLEVIVPAEAATAWLVGRALGALVVGAAMTRRECAALLEPALAREYCAFHHGKEQRG